MTYKRFTDEDSKIDNCDYVQFNAFFTRDLDQDGYAEKIAGTCKEIGESDTLYMDINVLTQGYLKNGQITLNAKNFTWTTAIVDDNIVDGDYIGETSKIKLDDNVVNGSQKLMSGTISSKIENNINNYSQISSVTLTGTYVSDDGQETEINKTVELTVDWYGITKTEVNKYAGYNGETQNMNMDELEFGDNSVTFPFTAYVTETEKELLLQKQVLEITVPKLNDFSATKVIVEDTNVEYQYDEITGILTITRLAETDENGNVTKTISRANFNNIKITYPMEAYAKINGNSIIFSIPIKGYNYGYNNTNEEFQNPYVSEDSGIISVTYFKTKGYIWDAYPTIGERIYNPDLNLNGGFVLKQNAQSIYNGNEYEDLITEYPVSWEVAVNDTNLVDTIILEEQKNEDQNVSDKFLDASGNYDSMYNYIKTTGIYFSDAQDFLGDDGWIKLYNNETGLLIETFTSETFQKYNKWNPYKVDLKSIKIETSKPVDSNYLFSITQIKELNDILITKNYTKSQFDNLKYVYTYLKGTIKAPQGITYDNGTNISQLNIVDDALYMMPYSVSNILVEPENITNQNTQNIKMTIKAKNTNLMESKWKNGRFLVEIPENIISLNIRNIKSLNKNVEILSYETYKENGKNYIKIYTKNEEETGFAIEINAKINANPLMPTSTQEIILYSYNEKCDNYYTSEQDIFDLDTDGNTSDNVGKITCPISIISPSGLITAEYITNYDDEGNITIAPNIAQIEKLDETKTATINIGVTNNYSGTISDVVILGKIPFKGNTYIINGQDLKSQFTATMKSEINVPEQLKDKITVYYSTNEKTNENLIDETNNWVKSEQVKDWSKIRTYLILFNDYVLQKDENQIFTYDVEISEKSKYNQVSYSNHAVYYNLDTENGKLAIKTEPDKVGIRIFRKYNIKLTKNKESFENIVVKGATYKITTTDIDGQQVTKTGITNENGILKFDELYIGQEYILKEIVAPIDYEVNTDEIKFIINTNEDGEPVVEVKEGNFSKTPQIIIDENGNYEIQVNLEDKAKYDLIINKTNENGEKLENVKFLINGKDHKDEKYKTNTDGIIKITGLYLDETYELSEIESDGYYTDAQPRKFKLVRGQDGVVTIQTQDEDLQKAVITEDDTTIKTQVNVNIVNKKIPTYNINIVKVEENTEEDKLDNLKKLENASFSLLGQDTGKYNEYSTDENGSISISGLYEYVDGKYITGKYTLQEIKAPEGYSNNTEEINFKAKRNEQGELQVEVENQSELESIKSVYVQDNTIYFVLQDKPAFKLTKIDSETKELLANAKFVIYELDDDLNALDYAKDINGNYVGVKDENGNWVVTTGEDGTISIHLRDGKYRIDEIDYPEGYAENGTTEYFIVGEDKTEVSEDNNKILEINYIEDLVDLAKATNKGNNYEGTTVLLIRDLNFNEDNSYKNPKSKSYGDLNKDGTIEGIKAELTDKNDGYGFTPIGVSYGCAFSGKFDGQGYEIKNLYINANPYASYIGLFGYIANSEIKNLGLTESLIIKKETPNDWVQNTQNIYIGGIVGYASRGNIDNCYNTGNINNYCDFVNPNIENGYAPVTINIGGIVGEISGNISNSYNTGVIKNNCINEMYNVLNSIEVGGIVGDLSGTVSSCYNTGKIESDNEILELGSADLETAGGVYRNQYNRIGGIVGFSGNIKNSYNTGDVTVTVISDNKIDQSIIMIGGLSGKDTVISNSYNTGNVITNYNNEKTLDYVGGIIGYGYGGNNNYYLKTIDIKGKNINSKGTPKDDNYMKSKNFYDDINKDKAWLKITSKYPILINKSLAKIKPLAEITIENTIKKFKITTDVNEINGIKGGSITGEDEEPYETVIYDQSNTKEIIMKPNQNYKIANITINGNRIEYKVNDDGTYTIPAGYFENMKEDKHIVVTYEAENNFISITKTDDFTGELIPNTKFIIYEINENKAIIDYAKNNTGDYIGIKNEKGQYVVTTDENGKIELRLNEGYYKAVEIEAAPGYLLSENNTTYFAVYDANVIIDSIEDLVKLSKTVNSGETTYSNETVILIKTLDFNEDSSYENPNDTSYGDLNGDGTIEGIKAELTNKNGIGFTPIGSQNSFQGTFDGREHEIRNIYINSNGIAGLFGNAPYAKIINLGLTGDIRGEVVGGLAYLMFSGEITNCYSSAKITTKSTSSMAGGLIAHATHSEITNCYNLGSIEGPGRLGGFAYSLNSNSKITNCYNSGNINNTSNSAGGFSNEISGSCEILNCYNTGNVSCKSASAGGFAFSISTSSKILNCYNTGNTSSEASAPVGGLAYGISGSKIINCYNTGAVESKSAPAVGLAFEIKYSTIANSYNAGILSSGISMTAGIGFTNTSNTITNIYYLNTSAPSGMYNGTDVSGQIESKTEQEMKSKAFTDVLNANKRKINADSTLVNWVYKANQYPTLLDKYDADFVIESIEDLVKLSNTVNSGVNYSGKTVILTKTLDFNNDNSYDNPNDTSYGDLNGDGTTEGIKAELTNKNGIGFTPIGRQYSFQGTFDGRGHEIANIYINSNGIAGLFGYAPFAKIRNLGLSGDISGSSVGGLAYSIDNSEITNCYNSAKITTTSTSSIAGGLITNATNSEITNCYNLGSIKGPGELGGFVLSISMCKVTNCYNSGDINNATRYAGGFSSIILGNSEIVNCYNTGNVSCKSAPAAGLAFSITNSKMSNCYNIGKIISETAAAAGLINKIENSTIANCYNAGIVSSEIDMAAGVGISNSGATIANTYYLNTSATSGIYNTTDVEGQIESKTEQEMKSKAFTDLLNANIENISTDTTLLNWKYEPNKYPTVGIPTYTNGSNIEIKNQKGTDIIVHHYYKNPDGTYTTNKVATDDIYVGKVGDKYTTNPHINLPDITLEKDANGKYVIPSNAVGTYSETPIEVTYYYEAQPIKLTIHHYLAGTEDKLVEDETIETQAQINFAEDGTYTITTNANYTINENSNYKKLIDKYNFVNVQTTIKENADISDTLEYNTTSELTYYYTSKQYQITTEVKPHKELRTNKTTGQKEEISVKGGTISGENETPYETVKHGENSEKEIKITPDKYYRVKTITLQSTKEDGTETTTVIYGENADENSEIKSVTNLDNSVTLTNFTNVTENKKIIVEFEIPMSTVIVHHIIVGQTQDYKTQEYVDYPEENYNTSQIIIPGYVLVRKSENTSGKFETDVINVYYYYNNQFNYTVEYYYEDKETGDFVQDDDATEKTEALYGDIITEYQDKVKPGYVFDSVTPEDVNGKVKLIISGNEENNVIKVYYKLADFSYRVEYYYKDIDTKQYIQDTDKTDTFEAKYLDVIKSVNDKIITGYKFDKIEPESESGSDETEDSSGTNVKKIATNLTITEIADNNVIKVYYSPANIGYTVEYYYDGIIDNTLTQGPISADYKSIITTYEDKVKPGYVFINVTPVDNNNKLNLTITEDLSKNVIKVYYKSQYKITTDVIEHTENYSDGTVKQNVKGGTISGEDEEPYEKVIINENSTKPIIATPDQDYEIIGIKINDEILDYTNYEENGVVTLGEGYFKNMTENKHVIVEFRKKSKVTYNYLEETTNKKLADSEESTGYDGKEYTPYSHEKAISNYELTKVQILDSNNNVIEEITEITEEKIKEIKKMYADDITVNYIYSRIKSNVVVKHIEINEKDQIGTVLDTENITGGVETTVTTNRKNYDGYISVDSPKDTETTAILVQANENSKDVIIKENTVIEVWYYYEKQFKINTEVIPHTENIDGNEVSVFGGTISKEYKKDENGEFILDQSGNKIEVDYEIVNNRGDNKKKIEIIPDNGYRIKKVTVNGEDVAIEDNSKKSLTLDEGYFTDIKNDILVSVEFERIPAKVIVKYLEYGTKETLNPDKIINGFVNDKYDEKRVDISGYIPCNENGEKSSSTTGDLSDIEPDNSKGVMTENDIVVIYYYTKEFIITTDIDEHLEYEDDVLDIRTDNKNDDKSEDNKNDGDKSDTDNDKADDNKSDESKKQKLVKGGTITSELTPENQEPVETVLKGKNSTKPIIIKPDKGYRIKTVKIYEGEKDENGKFEKQPIILDLEEFISKEELEKGGTITIPESYFKNVQSNKHIVTEFEKIPVMIIVNYLDVETNSRVAKSEYAQGTIDQKYLTNEKQIDFYNIVEEKIPENKEGNLSEKQIETSIENKLDMLNKLNSELSDKSDETTEKLIEILKNKNVVIVNYYYKKLPFNLSINKEFTSVKVNGTERLENDNKFVELSIPNTEISNTNIDVTYKITVTNTEQIEGKAVILEQIPVGFEVVEKQNSEWKLNESGDLQLTTEVLKPGESVEYEIELHWNEKMKCFGLLENIAKINETRNLCGFDETRLDDNKDSCKLVLSVRTGKYGVTKNMVAISCVILAEILTVVYVVSEVRDRKRSE